MASAARLYCSDDERWEESSARIENDRRIEALYRQYNRALSRFLRKMLTPEEADDVVQEVFVRICRVDDLDKFRSPGAVIFKTAYRLALNEKRRQRTCAISSAADIEQTPLVSEQATPEVQVIAATEHAAYRRDIGKLPKQCQRVMWLRAIDGLSYKEISFELGLAISTLEKHMVRGRRALQDTWAIQQARCDLP